MNTALRRQAAIVATAVPGLRQLHHWEQTHVRSRLWARKRDAENRRRYGAGAPMFAERLWIDPLAVEQYVVEGSSLSDSGRVALHDFVDGRSQAIEDDPIVHASVARWVHGLPWEETGEIERMEQAIRRKGPMKGCRTRADILARCARLDAIFATIERERRVRPQVEVEPSAFREVGGIGVHIGPGGVPVRAANGRHRFAMARILGIRSIPVRVAVVHHSAVPMLDQFRLDPVEAG